MRRALVVYESMYGNTHEIAAHIGEGLRAHYDVLIVPVDEASPELVADAALVVVGGPTHVHGMSSGRSRKAAVDAAEKDPDLVVDDAACGAGLRDWFDSFDAEVDAAAFDTRIDAPPALTGRACRGVARRLRRRGCRLVAEPESFLVNKHNHLLDGEAERATLWGKELASRA